MLNLKVANNNLIASNVSILEGGENTTLTADKAAGQTTLTVANIGSFAVGKYCLLGNFGEPTAEIVRIHASTPPASGVITLAAATVYDHYVDTPITMIEWNQIEFSRATTLGGSKSVLTTVGIMANHKWTNYTDLTNSTGYAFYRFKNSSTSAFSSYSTGVPYTGNPKNSMQQIVEDACSMASVDVNEKFADEKDLLTDINEAQNAVIENQNWVFEMIKDDTSIATTQNENRYALTALTYAIKFPGTFQGILNVRFGSEPLLYVSPDEMDDILKAAVTTTLNNGGSVSAGATSVTLTDSSEFSSSGSITLGSNVGVAYTANDKTTGVLSGISASAITSTVADGSSVWQGINPGKPTKYTIFNGYIVLNCPVSATEYGKKLKIKYLKQLTAFTDYASTTEIPFCDCLKYYVASKIFTRKQATDDADKKMAMFLDKLQQNAAVYQLPALEEQEYYAFASRRTLGSYYDDVTNRFNN